MKKIKFILSAILFIIVGISNAQVTGDVASITPPLWGPVGYNNARYYYLPDVESYYDINTSKFIYLEGKNWTINSALPAQYANYDIDHGYKVVLTGYLGNTPYTHFSENRKEYASGYRGKPQTTFKDNLVPRTDNGPPIKLINENHESEK